MKKGITVIICSYNGAPRIPDTIAHIAAQSFSAGLLWEVIFVNNASTDNTGKIALQEWGKYNLPTVEFKVLTEPKAGKIYALHYAISETRFEYFIICDDDNWLNPDYVETMYNLLEKNNTIGAAGGQSKPVTDGNEFPVWFEQMATHYAVGMQAEKTGDITGSRGYLWGAGMGSRTSLYKKMYTQIPSLLTGRKGQALTAGEDAEYCQRIVLSGYSLYYDSSLLFQHFIPGYRLTESYRDKLVQGIEGSEMVIEKYRQAIKLEKKYGGKQFKKTTAIITYFIKNLFQQSDRKATRNRTNLQYLLGRDTKHDKDISNIKKFMSHIAR